MADASLTDVVKKLDEVKSAVKSGEVATGAERLAAGEAAAEGARTDAKRMGIFQAISDKLNIFKGMKGDDSKTKGFFGKLLSGFKLGGLVTGFGSLLTTGLSTAFTGLGKLFGPTLIKVLGKAGPIALIVAGLSMAIQDGIALMFKSEDMGVSKVGAFFGGFFGGAAGGGIQNAFANAGKFALIGAGIGALMGAGIFSIPGAIIGGLLGAALGGILGYIGGEKLAKSFDGIGTWFSEKFSSLIIQPIKNIWDIIAPDWAKSVTDTFKWSDLLPPAVNKLLNGEYFKVTIPDFNFTWTDLFPPFLTKFFAGDYAVGKDEFQWKDLLPPFLKKIFEADYITPTGEFSWYDLVPKFISDLIAAEKGKVEGDEFDFDWRRLLPEWMVGAFDSTKGMLTRTKGSIENFFADIAMGIKMRMVAIIDGIADIIPGMTSTAEASVDKLKKLGLFDENLLEKDTIDAAKLKEALAQGTITGTDIQNLIKKQGEDVSAAALAGLQALVPKSATGETGGLITQSGFAKIHQGELLLDNQAAAVFLKASQLLIGSQVLEQSRMGGGDGAPVIINNNNVDNSMQSSQTTAVSIPAPTRTNESTVRALQMTN